MSHPNFFRPVRARLSAFGALLNEWCGGRLQVGARAIHRDRPGAHLEPSTTPLIQYMIKVDYRMGYAEDEWLKKANGSEMR